MLRDLRHLPLGAIEPRLRGGGGGMGHARVGGFGGLAGKCLGERDFGVAGEPLGIGERGVAGRQVGRGTGDGGFQRLALGIEPGERIGGVVGEGALARAIVSDTRDGLRQFGEAAAGCLFLGAQAGELMRDLAAAISGLKRRGAGGGEGCRGLRLIGGGSALGLSGRRNACLGRRRFGLCCVRSGGGIAPAREDHPRLCNADLGREGSVFLRLARLAAKRGSARFLVGDDLVETFEVRLGCAQFLLGVAAADMEASDPGRFLQHGAAVGRPGRNDRADAALADERRRVGAGRGIGEEQRHVLRAHVLAVDTVGAAGAALDAADDLGLGAVHFGKQGHFGEVARRARGGAGEDHVFHAGAAHRFRAVLAHRPAQRFEQVGLAAAVGADDAGQPRLDAQIGRIDEALEAGKAEALDLHG